mmetsp:Transcript_53301/g.105689  ORF Transcript_53301/g.105689 Transcript_53301/m.105689 type:complete len:278 (+) Transcript_53301:754-1587(+)
MRALDGRARPIRQRGPPTSKPGPTNSRFRSPRSPPPPPPPPPSSPTGSSSSSSSSSSSPLLPMTEVTQAVPEDDEVGNDATTTTAAAAAAAETPKTTESLATTSNENPEASGGEAVAVVGVTAAVVVGSSSSPSLSSPSPKDVPRVVDVHSSAARLDAMRALVREATRSETREERNESLGVSPADAKHGSISSSSSSSRHSAGGKSRSAMSPAAAKEILTACPCAHPTYAPTLASVVLDPSDETMHIRFGEYDQKKGLGEWTRIPLIADSQARGKIE